MRVDKPIRIVLLEQSFRFPVYEEIFHALHDSLSSLQETETRRIAHLSEVQSEDELLFLTGTPLYYHHLDAELRALRARFPHVKIFLWQMEPVPDTDTPLPKIWLQMLRAAWHLYREPKKFINTRGANLLQIRRLLQGKLLDHVFVFTTNHQAALKARGISSEFLPVGYHPVWGENRTGAEDRDIDVLFLGGIWNKRRETMLEALRDELKAHGVTLKTFGDFNPDGLWGEERNAVLNRTKLFLCIYTHGKDSSGTRMSLGIGNGAMIISEPIFDPHPFVAGKHYVESRIEDLPVTLLTYLRDDAVRERICQEATQLLYEKYTMLLSAQKIMEVARQHRERTL